MAQHMIAYHLTVSAAPADQQPVTPVPDPTVTINGNAVQVPDKYNQVLYAAGLIGGGSISKMSLQAPSLRDMFFPYLTDGVVGNSFQRTRQFSDFSQSPLQLVTNEGLEFYSDGNNGTTATTLYGLVILGDGKVQPTSGKIFTIRATASAALAGGQWVNSPLEFAETLPVGQYDVVGMRVEGDHLRAARLVFIGPSAVTRPGVFANSGPEYEGSPVFRMGNNGVFGTFDSTTPPSVEFLGDTNTSEVVYLDLIKRS